MNDFLAKLRLFASTLAAIVTAGFIVGLGVTGKLAPPDIDGSIKFEADIFMSPARSVSER